MLARSESRWIPVDAAAPPRRPLRWLYIDLNSYFASVEQQLNPRLRGKPVAIGPERIGSGTIIAASYEAKAYGVKTGMKVAEARRLCPGLLFAGSGHGRYVAFHERIVAEVQRHAPVAKVCSIDEVAVRLCDNENSPEVAAALARRIKAGILRNVGECLTASVGIAPSRLLAKMAADMMKPDGLTVLTAADLPRRLHPLKLTDIPGVGPRMLARLNAAGIATMKELLSRAPRAAAAAWGSVVGERLWWELHGHDLLEPPQRSRSVGHSHVLAPQLRDMETARLTARRLLVKAAERLRRAGFETRFLTLYAQPEIGGDLVGGCRLEPTDDSFALLEALDGLWPSLLLELRRRAARVRLVGVSLDDMRPARGQLSLWSMLPPDDPLARRARTPALSAALDAIAERFGRDAVSVGPPAEGRARLIGTKVAFNRIPMIIDCPED